MILRYGCEWDEPIDELTIELTCIRQNIGDLFEHYKRAMTLLWPDDDWHRWVDLSLKTIAANTITVLMGPADCVAGDTKIYDPITGESPTIKSLCDNGIRPTVMTGLGPKVAGVPFIKGHDELFEVRCSNGKRFRATKRHLVLDAEQGWIYVGDLRSGSQLLSFESGRSQSILDIFPSVRTPNAFRSNQKAEGSAENYSACSHLCGARPLWDSGGVRQPSPSPTCAPKHTERAFERGDGLDYRSGHTRPRQSPFHPSISDFSLPVEWLENDPKRLHVLEMFERAACLFRQSEQFQIGYYPCQPCSEQGPDFDSKHQSLISCHKDRAPRTLVQEIVSIGSGDFYDLTVPDAHHYFAEGFIHHNSGKTYLAAKWALVEYWAAHRDTLCLISSTDLRGLELRVWGAIKQLFNRAKERYPMLPGYPLDSQHCIATEQIDDDHESARVLNRGIVCIPCLQSGRYIGLKNYLGIKAPRLRQVSDECFVAGTLIDTPFGLRPIESLVAGDLVLSAAGPSSILRVGSREVTSLVRISTKDGRTMVCTPDHPFLTQFGWIKALHLNQSHYMVSQYESMQILWQPNTEQVFLQSVLRGEIRNLEPGATSPAFHEGQGGEDQREEEAVFSGSPRSGGVNPFSNDFTQPDGQSCCEGKSQQCATGHALGTSHSRRKWHRADGGGEVAAITFPRREVEFLRPYVCQAEQRISRILQIGHSLSAHSIGSRGRRSIALLHAAQGREENGISQGSWVDRVEVYEPGHSEQPRPCGICYPVLHTVFNLQVELHPSYSVNGLVAHNCQLMGDSHLDAVPNYLGKDYKGVFLGNPIDPMDPLGRIGEPECGWSTHPEPDKTTVWKTRMYEGHCVNLVGTDSPNFDYPIDKPIHFLYLVNRKKIDTVKAFWGEDSPQYFSQCVGIMKSGLLAKRIITMDLCRQHHAMEKAWWKDDKRTRVHATDIAYGGVGGDRCVTGWGEFGLSNDGSTILRVNKPVIIPISLKSTDSPESQIAKYVKHDLDILGIPASGSFYDSTGRGTMGSAFAQAFGSQIPVPVEFGGRPTRRAARDDLYIFDEYLRERRNKRCDEEYVDFVSELWFSSRYAIMADQIRELPEDVIREGCQREYGTAPGNRFYIESKHDPKARERMRQSPDLYDWFVTLIEGARRLGFRIERLGADLTEDNGNGWLEEEAKKHFALVKSKQLAYR